MSDQIAEHIDTASEAMHLGAVTPEYPSDIALRADNLVDLLGNLSQITLRLARAAEAAPTSFDLGSDDHTPLSSTPRPRTMRCLKPSSRSRPPTGSRRKVSVAPDT